MAHTVREIERKYEAAEGGSPPDLTRLRSLRELPDAATLEERAPITLDATYYDTADRRLAADGITLRRRTGGADEGWHLKLPVRTEGTGRVVRDEIRAPLAERVPDELAALLRSRTLDAPLTPLIRLRTRRRVGLLRDAAGHDLAEISVDRVTARRPGPHGDTRHRFTEVEVELAEGADPDLLDRIEPRLTAAGLRPATADSKLARALAATEPADRPPEHPPEAAGGPSEDGRPAPPTAGDVVLDYARHQIDAIVALDPAVRRDVPDSVHRMRVATRRLRSTFRSYRRLLDRAVTDPLGAELKWLAAELGADRDLEVLTDRLGAALDGVPETLRLGPVRARLQRWSQTRRGDARTGLLAVLDSERYLALLGDLRGLTATPPTGPTGAPLLRPAAARGPGREIGRAVLRELDRLAARVDAAYQLPPGPDRDQALHNARKAAKRARYAAEAAQPWLGKPAKRLVKRITKVQKLLGEHQDSVLARTALREIAAQAHAAGESTFTLGLLHGREEARATEAQRALPEVWAKASRKKYRAPLSR
ncbi:CYTH and CHAD domain-containing protein [Streptomyces palmae]|uniref:CYTH and CHAD domain-containing protein n=1 Tax=Streptomyces palmae TaxID=1701085 RepID=A0A4Z0HHI4_9ACTN|nr:CYTH and CHAD domain-containing protein [Streptomyces palmae]TGB16207.1 CYTH and CHAD domain-containing protein [Streptomyces palmae]